ncbi:hypothetical protein ACIQOV_42755, partial [Kitasatospora sp. NPDC091257]|uniref:hypothetical protein n=1 Tax=Kitasatospora sp. NPDC091257 TaxID=3364084 RepID=UPI0038191335
PLEAWPAAPPTRERTTTVDPMMALSVDTAETTSTADFDDLYGRYSTALLVAAAEQLSDISPAATDLDEDLADAVWDDVAAGHYPEDARGLDGLLILLHAKVRRVRQRPATAAHTIRQVVIDLDDLADTAPVATIPTARPLPTTAGAVAALRALPLAG